MTDVVVVIGPGSIGQAIARRVSAGKHIVLADLRENNADAAAKTLGDAGFDVSTAQLMGADGGFITGSDFLMDGGVTASYWYGELAAS